MTIAASIRAAFERWLRHHHERKHQQALEDLARRLDRHTREDIGLRS
jgi:hypothetical protein